MNTAYKEYLGCNIEENYLNNLNNENLINAIEAIIKNIIETLENNEIKCDSITLKLSPVYFISENDKDKYQNVNTAISNTNVSDSSFAIYITPIINGLDTQEKILPLPEKYIIGGTLTENNNFSFDNVINFFEELGYSLTKQEDNTYTITINFSKNKVKSLSI